MSEYFQIHNDSIGNSVCLAGERDAAYVLALRRADGVIRIVSEGQKQSDGFRIFQWAKAAFERWSQNKECGNG